MGDRVKSRGKDYVILDENGEVWGSAATIRQEAGRLGWAPKRLAERDAGILNEEAAAMTGVAGYDGYRAVVDTGGEACRHSLYHAPGLGAEGRERLIHEILRFVGGIRHPRTVPVSRKRIETWFHATDRKFLGQVMTALIVEGRLMIRPRSLGSSRRHNGAYVYSLPEADPVAVPVNGDPR